MASGATDLVARAKKFREVSSLQHDSIQNVAETLEKISKFLQDHETPSTNDCTHTVFDNYSDWWMHGKPTYKLAVAEDNTVDQLRRMIAQCYDLGIPLTLTEKRTPVIRFIQEVEIWGTQDETVTANELIDCQGAFMKLLGKIMGIIYPQQAFLDCAVFDATGLSRSKGIQKTSVRLVWSNILVNRERAGKIHDYVVYKFKDAQDEDIKTFEARVQGYSSKENQWCNIFNDGIYFGRFGIRMPLCDRVSPAPLKKPERRPFKPTCVVRCHYQAGDLQTVENVCNQDALTGEEWLKIGCVRRDTGEELTEWTAPVWTGTAPSRTRPSGPVGGGGGGDRGDRGGGAGGDRGYVRAEPGARQPGQVRIRTSGGSGDRPVRAAPRTAQQVREEHLITVQREFDGTLAEFREQIEKVMGGQQGANFTEDDGTLVWKQPSDTGRIEMKASNRRVYLTGKTHQVRSLCMTVAPFVRQVGDAATSVASGQTGASGPSGRRSRPGSEYGAGPSSGHTPSNAFAPSTVYAPSSVYAPSKAFSGVSAGSGPSQRSGHGTMAEPSKRVANREFEPEGQGELELKEGDLVTVTHDPEQGEANIHRWVHGYNEATEKRGWFPLSYTSQVQAAAETEQAAA